MTSKKEEEKKIFQYGDVFGSTDPDNILWNDMEKLKEEIIKYKIINIKIYYNSGNSDSEEKNNDNNEEEILINKEEEKKEGNNFIEEKYIVGITLTFKNLYNGEIKVLEHKGSDQTSGRKN